MRSELKVAKNEIEQLEQDGLLLHRNHRALLFESVTGSNSDLDLNTDLDRIP